jgi:hypothetical protein
MKTFTICFFFLFAALYGSAQNNVTWTSTVKVSDKSFGNLHPKICIDRKGNPMLIWGSSNNSAVYFSKWSGTAFSMPKKLNPSSVPIATATWMGPDIASHGDTVYVTYKQTPEQTGHSYIVSSFDGGSTFSAPVLLDNISDSLSRFPIVTTDDKGNPIVAFMKFTSTFSKASYVVMKSNDFGKTFGKDRLASNFAGEPVCDCCPASVISAGNSIMMLYRNNNNDLRDIWAGVSTDNGKTFPKGFHAEKGNWMINACPASGPQGIVNGDSLYSVFMSQTSGTSLVYLSKSSVSGLSNVSSQPISGKFAGLTSQNYPRIALEGNSAAIVWRQTANGTAQFCMVLAKNLQKGFPAKYEVIGSGDVVNGDVKMNAQNVFVIWEDDNNGTVMFQKGTYSNSGIADNSRSGETFRITPNPANNYFTISTEGEQEIKAIYVIDMLGKQEEIKGVQSANNQLTFNTQDLKAGIYQMAIVGKNGNYSFSKLVVQK